MLAVTLAVRASYWAALEATPLAQWHLWQDTDAAAFLAWSESLAAGNWLDVPPFRPYFSWQALFGPPEAWDHWYPRNAYHSGPLYAYLLALLRLAFGSPVVPVRLLQLLLASFTAACLTSVTRDLASRVASARVAASAAIFAGLLYGTYGPSVFHDAMPYRDGPLAHLSTLLLLLPLSRRLRTWHALPSGWLSAVTLMTKQTTAPLALASVAVTVVRQPGSRTRAAALATVAFASIFSLFVARNLSVGVSPWVFDTRQGIGVAWGNIRGADASTKVPPALGAALAASGGSVVPTARVVLASYRGHLVELPILYAKKLATFFHGYEVPDNASFAFFRDRLPLLRALPSFAWLLGPGLVGLVVALRSGSLRRAEWILAWVAFLTPLAACLAVQTTSRYRVAAIGPLALGAGLLAGWLATHLRDRRAAAALVSAAAVSGLTLLPAVIPTPRYRFSDALVYAMLLEHEGQPGAAAEAVTRWVREGVDDPAREGALPVARAWWSGFRPRNVLPPSMVVPPEKRFAAEPDSFPKR